MGEVHYWDAESEPGRKYAYNLGFEWAATGKSGPVELGFMSSGGLGAFWYPDGFPFPMPDKGGQEWLKGDALEIAGNSVILAAGGVVKFDDNGPGSGNAASARRCVEGYWAGALSNPRMPEEGTVEDLNVLKLSWNNLISVAPSDLPLDCIGDIDAVKIAKLSDYILFLDALRNQWRSSSSNYWPVGVGIAFCCVGVNFLWRLFKKTEPRSSLFKLT
jgi:hypothetical protein